MYNQRTTRFLLPRFLTGIENSEFISYAKSFNAKWAELAVLAVLSALPVFAATITVTNTNDSGAGSLRDAIGGASPGDMINFSLAYPATITLASTLAIGTSLMINGPGAANLAISGNNLVQVFNI